MASKPLDILKKGLKISFKAKKEDLEAKLSRQESISSSDEQWLDNEGNTIDEQLQRVIQVDTSVVPARLGLGLSRGLPVWENCR
jgi:hypothetical protein